ncbi:hypothetical protein JCM8097_006571 [Rhodosporidiobolus ruineniae]
MPTVEDYASDPDDFELTVDEPVRPSAPALDKGKGVALPADLLNPPAGEPTIPKALRIGFDGSLRPAQPAEFAGWDTLYPIYVDAKRPQQDGARRVNKKVALEWPMAEQMAKAARMLGFESVFEPSKTHPKDWENPGRIKVLLKSEDGKPKNATIKNKRILLVRICDLLRPHQPTAPPATASNPHPLPPIHKRLPPNSPAISHGTLEDALKGGGLGGMLGGMFGGGDDDDKAIEEAEEARKRKKEEDEKKQREMMAKMGKLKKKVHIRRR